MKKRVILLTFAMCLILTGCGSSSNSTDDEGSESEEMVYTDTVSVTGGDIRGYIEDGVYIYKGIPYAAAPVGELRWKAPQDVESWEGVLDCTQWSASAMQSSQSAFLCYSNEFIISEKTYSEDCLYLNVWTTAENGEITEGMPVIVYIHGGAYTSGGSSCEIYEGSEIAKKGVVFVSINYRLGIFGYLSTSELLEEDASAGNYGMMDQIKALEWVQENIAAFGGDPDNVTIMGQSAGAQSVSLLVASQKAAGLFSRAVIMSSNAIVDQSLVTSEERAALGDKATSKYTLEELRAMSAEDLLKIKWKGDGKVGSCIDGIYLTGSYEEIVASGQANDVDIMIGMADNTDTSLISTQTDAWFYDYCTAKNVDSTEGLMGALNYQVLARNYAGNYESSVYIYDFSHMMPGKFKWIHGTFHTSDVPYFLNIFVDSRADYWTDADYTLGDVMSSYLVNFAKTGDPNGDGLTVWEENTGNWNYMQLDTTCSMQTLGEEEIEKITAYHESLAYLFEE